MKESLIRLCSLLILALASYILADTTVIATNSDISSDWSIFTIDDVDAGSYVHHSYTSIAVDNEDGVHISYRGPNYDLRYATKENSDWLTEVVYDKTQKVARENSIALDSNNHPHISFSYRDGGNENLMVAKNITGTWVTETIDDGLSVGMENDIAIDNDDRVHISHWQWNGANLRYSTNSSGIWETDEIADHAYWRRTSIAIDSLDKVHIVYDDNGHLFYATNLSGTWAITDTGIIGSNPAMAIDTNDKIHISYTNDGDLEYATNVSGLWETQIVTSGVAVGRHHSIALDNDNKVHISYYDSNEGSLKYANNAVGSWSMYTIDNEGDVGRSNSIAIDSHNNVHISYRYDSVNPSGIAKLKHATNAPPAIEFTHVPPYGSFENLEGWVEYVAPTNYNVAVYIYVSGWWTKPTFANPLTSIQPDGTWVTDITTGGLDQNATKIIAYLVPNGYNPPPMSGGQTLPSELEEESVAKVMVEREPIYRTLEFSGYIWRVKARETPVGPGPNYFSDEEEDVWVDEDGRLHLKIVYRNGRWYSTEVFTTEPLGYGTYTFTLASRVDQLDKNVVLGLFTWDDTAPEHNYREIDIEFARWGEEENDNAQYVVQPWNHSGNLHRFNMELEGYYSTHSFTWRADSVQFSSFQGHGSPFDPADEIESWLYTGSDIPPEGVGNARINLWLFNGNPPSDGQEVEVIIEAFECFSSRIYLPLILSNE